MRAGGRVARRGFHTGMRRLLSLAFFALASACQDQAGGRIAVRDRITAVGSSTVFPFTAIVAERFVAADPAAKAPVIESTGTGAGLRLFCAGVGAAYPDIVGASRRMRRAEYDGCAARGVRDILEVPIGLDGIAFAESRQGPALRLTPAAVYRALAAFPGGRPNAARTWRDADPALPAIPIRVYGPPATSGTRDALAELVLARGCRAIDPAADAVGTRCTRIRDDGAYVDAGENDNLVVQKLAADPKAIGVFGYGYLRENVDTVRGVSLGGVMPTYAAIADGRYPGARPLYLYVKRAHLSAVPGLAAFLRLYASNWSPGGPLVRRGLVANSAPVRARAAAIVAAATPLDPASLS